MSSARVLIKPTPGISGEQARDIRARAWAYAFECFERHMNEKPAKSDSDAGNDGKEIKRVPANSSIPDE